MMGEAGTMLGKSGARAIAALSVLCLVGATPVLAQGLAESYDQQPAASKTVRETDNDVRAHVRYFAGIPSGGQEEIVNDDGTVSLLHWDGWIGVFEVEQIGGMAMGTAQAESFVRDAIVVLCPSVDRGALAEADVSESRPGPFFHVSLQCPEIDAKVHD